MNCVNHLKTIMQHKGYVMVYSLKAGIPLQGILHDLSKLSPTEFFESIHYYTGFNSPIDNAKKDKGFSYAWLHHKGRNKHHYEYWRDGEKAIKMPFKYALEMICDFLAAGRTYSGSKFTLQGEYEWWIDRKKSIYLMHPDTIEFVDKMLLFMKLDNSTKYLKKSYARAIYNTCGYGAVVNEETVDEMLERIESYK